MMRRLSEKKRDIHGPLELMRRAEPPVEILGDCVVSLKETRKVLWNIPD